ncbi:hypothetical protein ACFWFF_34745 [Streptomyces sp. NPDC060223]|uniref:hypothetical protein n=1 Tax=unclassified Streptomyces TaxID=2593676 RepID=UPI003645A032
MSSGTTGGYWQGKALPSVFKHELLRRYFFTSWSSGQVEGHVTRVKLLKRMGFGRANLELLRRRVILTLTD